MYSRVIRGLEAGLAKDNFWLALATIAVFVGVLIEMAELLLFNKEMTRLQRGILFFATLLIAGGCGGEWIFEQDAAQKEARLQQLSDQQVGALTAAEAGDKRIATQAAAHAADLGVTVGNLRGFVTKEQTVASAAAETAERNAGAMTKALDSEREERQRFAAVVEPRTISDDQAKVLESALSPFHGQVFSIFTYWQVKEPTAFTHRLTAILRTAGWTLHEEKIQGEAGMFGGVTGVHVYVPPNAFPRTKATAAALIAALNKEQFDASPGIDDTVEDASRKDVIGLNVGGKP